MPRPAAAALLALLLAPGMAPAQEAMRPGAGIRRTMTLLATSTPEHRHRVRILFYGQSITAQGWWRDVADDLRRRFPHADLEISNRCLGGFPAPLLRRTAEADVYPSYPDLVLLHAYGPEPDYEALVREIRRRTTAEVAFLSDHVTWLPSGTDADDPGALRVHRWFDDHATRFLPDLASRLHCEHIEIREPWKRHLADNHLRPSDLLEDVVHLNGRGCALMASLVEARLQHDPSIPDDPWTGLVRDVAPRWDGGRLRVEFDGNKVDAVAEALADGVPPGTAEVRIDGRPPAAFPELYATSRTSVAIGSYWPAILRVGREAPPVAEAWTLRVLEADASAADFSFEVRGSVTGLDGRGRSAARFVSDSGRVVIEPGDWWTGQSFQHSKVPMKSGYAIRWKVEPLFATTYAPPAAPDPSREVLTTLAQGLPNGRHTLDLISSTGRPLPLKAIRVYRPPIGRGEGEDPRR